MSNEAFMVLGITLIALGLLGLGCTLVKFARRTDG